VISEYTPPTVGGYPEGITAGPDGNIWFAETGAHQIGRVSLPSVLSNPSSLTFPSQPYGTTSQPMTVTISNPGPGGPLAVDGVALGGTDPGDFAITSDGCTGATLAVHANPCNVTVTFTPTAVGGRSASLVVSDNALDSPQSVQLTGTGSPSADMALSLGASPNPVKFGTNLTYTITASNLGPTAASGVTVTDALPSTVQFVSLSATQGSCSAPAVNSSGTVNCSAGALSNGATATVKIVTRVVSTARTTVTDSASASSTSFDPNPSNNTATVTTNVFGRH
jgi:uncharacterized repeat protein (TIGR01451 family)